MWEPQDATASCGSDHGKNAEAAEPVPTGRPGTGPSAPFGLKTS
jgi:hypothetical protein